MVDKVGVKKFKKECNCLIEKWKDMVEKIEKMEWMIVEIQSDDEFFKFVNNYFVIGGVVFDEMVKFYFGDEENIKFWCEFLFYCLEDLYCIYDKFGVVFDYEYGESFYYDMFGSVVNELWENGLVEESQGVMCVFLEDFDIFMIIQKKDGVFLYVMFDFVIV